MALPLYIGASAGLRDKEGQFDQRLAEQLLREVTTALPTGVTLNPKANETLALAQPVILGEVLEDAAVPDKFEPVWEVLQRLVPPEIGVRLAVGTKDAPAVFMERKARVVAITPARYRHAHDILYGRR